uniref:Uncharacterized protein n=1 Tax=viral metagenome TaxID=1070528 RepID=A0A6C0I577_9ZZZZ
MYFNLDYYIFDQDDLFARDNQDFLRKTMLLLYIIFFIYLLLFIYIYKYIL